MHLRREMVVAGCVAGTGARGKSGESVFEISVTFRPSSGYPSAGAWIVVSAGGSTTHGAG